MQAASAEDSLIGFVLADKYRVVRQIGRGGMGVVYEAEHVALGKRVAIKLMLEKYADDAEAIARFQREALAASRIGNPHIIDVSDIGTAPDGRSFVVMELLTGAPLSQVLESTGPMAPWRAIHVMRQVLRAVGAAHAKGIIHRDLKPDNIFLVNQDDHHDFVKLLDFGISKHVDPDQQVAMTKLTTTGVVMGTPLYMAPEQAMGNPIERPADIYACGVILYEMLAGKPPFDGATYAVLVAKLLTTEPPRLDEVRPGLPPLLVRAVHRALEKDPAARFPTAELFAAALPSDKAAAQLGPIDLEGTLGTSSVPAVPVPSASPGRLRGLAIAVSAFAVAAAATATVLMMSKDDEPARPAAPAHAPTADHDPPAPPVASTGTLEIKTVPLGAAVTVDDVPRGSTPIVVTLEPGRHRVHVELAGHASLDSEEDVRENQRTSVVLRLPPAEPGAVATGRKPESPTPRDSRKPGGVGVRVPPGGGGARPIDPYPGASPGTNGGSGATVERVEPKAPPDDTKSRPPGNDDSRKPQGGSTKPNPY